MEIQTFLAMTAAEIQHGCPLPKQLGWMACHFSAQEEGLSNLPASLPPDSLLILDDSTPICGHDPERIAAQLQQCLSTWHCCGLLLDFQRPNTGELTQLIRYLMQALPCPVAVSEAFAADLNCPVFLPPLPHHVPLAEHIAPWRGREVWLELALDGETITLTESGSSVAPLPPGEHPDGGHWEETLHCHYQIQLSDDAATFTLWRRAEDLQDLLAEAKQLGISTAVGLYQELRSHPM